ncbi:MAG: hypothetical protein KatS3mg102_1405 [Planctomycetota bacterium]|nr:MAG: hypothetical protein KatS3mg102_1405 [Planctomycetota bacterium]
MGVVGPLPRAGEHDERALIEACLAGAPGAFERLIRRYARLVHHAVRLALERTGARHDSELHEEAFVRVFSALAADDMKALRAFRGRARLSTFLAVIARRIALRTLGELRPGRQAAPLGTDGESAEPADPKPGPAERAERAEVRAAVRQALRTLPARDALAIRLFYEEGLGHREIGAILGVPPTHVGQILARARRKLSGRLGRLDPGREGAGPPA